MKKTTLFAAAILGGVLSSQAQTTTEPVGFVSKTIPANSDATFAPAVQRAAAFVGTVGAIVDADTIEVGGTSPAWTTNQFVSSGAYYVIFGSGDREGLFAHISANSANRLDLSFLTQDLGTVTGDRVNVGDQIKIIPYWTLGTLLPDGAVADGTTVFLYSKNQTGINRSASAIFIMYAGFGWYDGPTDGNNQIIYPDESIIVRAPASGAVSVTSTGTVPMDKVRSVLENETPGQDQDIRVTSGVPVPIALSTMFNPGAAGDGDIVLIFNDASAGQNKSAIATVTYYNGFGWYDGPTDMNSYMVQPTQGLIYRKLGTHSATPVVVSYKPSYQP